jgi:segregation and condensation protein A
VLFAEIRATGGTAVATFLALLFLSHRGHVRLQQDDLFGDLWIRNPAVEWPEAGATDADAATPADADDAPATAETDDD